MYDLYKNGATLEEIGRSYGVTRERVRQIFVAFGLPTRSHSEAGANRRQAADGPLLRELEVLLAQGGQVYEIQTKLGVSRERLVRLTRKLVPDEVHRRLLMGYNSPGPRYSDEEMLLCLKIAAGTNEKPLTSDDYDQAARSRWMPDGRSWPLAQTIARRFGSWSSALEAGGISANPPSPAALYPAFNVDMCVAAVAALAGELARLPTAREYQAHAKSLGGWVPSMGTVRKLCGSWSEALRLVLAANADAATSQA